ncbi:hypothetical protein Ae168Ps1_6117 [Pseudonocardia sp. Ae168_Ps1]|uniref:MinD/ParA family ATP-binding protein n=1 Tax=unclassified Pseudonocardia TaxID=2619320 RepID=UPI00095D833C|nr:MULTISPECIES: MinD/ParA family protein [unclassified Pseudonocardia]OLL70248.1 hypothetical protein Ae150APs1_6051 [Pseudonocardia sp. Ae150A_Ps1]OLL70520.1 hypothetical protein Ae263Ps1_6270 [Pseudonocardia sp. Ae263_Ps1]OLL70652.1 hypothetical protein Ae168Ps1_6117 [Pseudonocardia sp. Ae168_Ps1]OLL89251.1 hypothetical protein Ae356Ps1_6170c [Pseudonocardia sp. Ae356_Ps1]
MTDAVADSDPLRRTWDLPTGASDPDLATSAVPLPQAVPQPELDVGSAVRCGRRPGPRSTSLPWDSALWAGPAPVGSLDAVSIRPAPVAPVPATTPVLQSDPSPRERSESVPAGLLPRDLGPARLNALRPRQSAPTSGWRAAAFRLSGGKWNPGPSAAEEHYTDLARRIGNTRLEGPHSVIVGSMKGGVGKTTVSCLLGLCLAEHRGDRVVAVDANPDAGTLADRLVGEEFAAQVTVRDLLAHLDEVETFTDLSKYVHLTRRLQVVASDQEPESSEAFSLSDYESVVRVLSRFAQAIITDLGTGIVHSAAQGGLKHCDSLVIVGTLTQDGASRAQRTLDYLANYRDPAGGLPHRHLVKDAVVVLSGDRWSESIDAEVIRDYFRGRVRAVLELPADRHLASGGPIDLALLQPATRDAVLEIAATVADGFYGRDTHGLAAHGFRSSSSHR